jgi:hypothetical protein
VIAQNAILQWRADDLESLQPKGWSLPCSCEVRKELQYTDGSKVPLISVEKIGESEPVPFKPDAKLLDGIRASEWL